MTTQTPHAALHDAASRLCDEIDVDIRSACGRLIAEGYGENDCTMVAMSALTSIYAALATNLGIDADFVAASIVEAMGRNAALHAAVEEAATVPPSRLN